MTSNESGDTQTNFTKSNIAAIFCNRISLLLYLINNSLYNEKINRY